MFLHAEEIAYKQQKEKRLAFNPATDTYPKGALIISNSKELINQIYV